MLRAYLRALPKLEAEEALKSANVAAYGGGTMREDDARAYGRRLQREIMGEDAKPKYATPQDAARSMGIEMVEKAT